VRFIGFFVVSLLCSSLSFGAGGGKNPFVTSSDVDISDDAAIQRGAKYFTNYCMGCHSTKYVRYQLMKKVGLSEEQIKQNLIFDGSKPGAVMTIAMPPSDAGAWFGAAAPDLTLESRLRHGPDWIYSYLKGFYSDPSRPMGVNNTVFPNVGMPNVLWELEGIKKAAFRYDLSQDGEVVASFDNEKDALSFKKENKDLKINKVVDKLVQSKEGSMSDKEFDQVARDLATYMAFIGEPIAEDRKRLGVYVLLFLSVFTTLAYLTKKEWWKDIH
tara:strand:- start:1405 stop:2217 length:813 start_codon:yes stop_codon:yes gene_type:complete